MNIDTVSRTEGNADKTKYIIMSPEQNTGRSHNIKIGSSTFERVEEFKYLGTTLTYQNSIQEEIMRRFNSWNACHHSVQNVFDPVSYTKI
jgi:hypothetical protein